ncbi:pentapeptide repeat-containing protein [Capilliphycus salinus ALCB114379]|uniref:pentapeptide repeat-containing protein n=1 Tax=Capilliphycus salinus TaxID=2768948 RepID=UPI0039A4F5F8
MANEEHLAQLKQGVEMWNQWRENNPEVKPDLRGVDLSGADLSGANLWMADLWSADLWGADLRGTDLSDTNLWRADLRGANLQNADLSGAYLWRADLRGADLTGVNLMGANLQEADLWGANLSEANLSEANLWKADFRGVYLKGTIVDLETSWDSKWKLVWQILNQRVTGLDLGEADLRESNLWKADLSTANLINADLWGADLREANLSGADLWGVNLGEADLSQANLEGADLWRANLGGADLSYANFTQANLTEANLRGTQILGTNFEGSTLTAACIEDWDLNSATNLNQVSCEYVYLKDDRQERCPRDLNKTFAVGEFTKLFQPSLETVDLTFQAGIDWQAFYLSFEALQNEYGSENLSIFALEMNRDHQLIIRFKVSPFIDKSEFDIIANQLYNQRLSSIEKKHHAHQKLEAKQREQALKKNANLVEVIRKLASDADNMSIIELKEAQ